MFKKILKQVANVANDIATYNDPRANNARSQGSAAKLAHPDGTIVEPVLEHLLRNVRSKHVRQHFAKTNPADYTDEKQVTVLVGSFNVNGRKPPLNVKISDWLGELHEKYAATDSQPGGPDVVAVGFQEIVSLNAGNVMGVLGSENVEGWDRALGAYLNGEDWATSHYGLAVPAAVPGSQMQPPVASALDAKWQGAPAPKLDIVAGAQAYVQVASKQMVGIYLSVWVRSPLVHAVRGVQVTQVATGFGGYLGNKGGVSARLRVYDSSLCFVCTHLSSGDLPGDEARRNADVADILRRCMYSPQEGLAAPMSSTSAALISASLGPGHWGDARVLTDHDVVIWLGDLNYRLNMADEEARKAIRQSRLEPLLEADQLVREMAAGRVFQGWTEGRVDFMPTFKFKVGTHNYLGDPQAPGTRGVLVEEEVVGRVDSEAASTGRPDVDEAVAELAEKQKRRTPAWCDRILWRSATSAAAPQLLGYWRGELVLSDHKPVAAGLMLRARHYNRKKIEGLLDAALRAVDMMQQSLRPRCTVEPPVLIAGTVQYGVPRVLTVQLANSGLVEAIFHFVAPPSGRSGKFAMDDDTPPLPSWLSAEPAEGIVEPGQTRDIQLQVLVAGGPGGAAATLALAPDTLLDSIIILRIEDSGDKFITITGSHVKSCLGLPLPQLAAYGPKPVVADESAVSELADSLASWSPFGEQEAAVSTSQESGLPKELAQLVDFLSHPEALHTPGLLTGSCQAVLGPEAQGLSFRQRQLALLEKLVKLRWCLDCHRTFPPGTTPHEVAALLLVLFGELPQPLIPQAVAEACAIAAPESPTAAVELLQLQLEGRPVELATLRAVLQLARALLQPEAAAANGLDALQLGGVLAEFWFPPVTGASAAVAGHQAAFVAALLVVDAPSM